MRNRAGQPPILVGGQQAAEVTTHAASPRSRSGASAQYRDFHRVPLINRGGSPRSRSGVGVTTLIPIGSILGSPPLISTSSILATPDFLLKRTRNQRRLLPGLSPLPGASPRSRSGASPSACGRTVGPQLDGNYAAGSGDQRPWEQGTSGPGKGGGGGLCSNYERTQG
jgi:hypothetical protein